MQKVTLDTERGGARILFQLFDRFDALCIFQYKHLAMTKIHETTMNIEAIKDC